MRNFIALFSLLIFSLPLAIPAQTASELRPPIHPYETSDWNGEATELDAIVDAALAASGASPRYPASDEVFLRRLYLDLAGTVPEPGELRAFRADARPDRVSRVIDALFENPRYYDYQTLFWCDLLRVKAEFPINLWPNAVQAYSRWIRDAVATNMPYDRFAGELLRGSGSNFRDPPSNFYRAVEVRSPEGIADAVALTFMASDRVPGMTTFFDRIAYKRTFEWKEEIVYLAPSTGPVRATFPDGTTVEIGAEDDPRAVFAEWLTNERNPYFARALVNRVWTRLMGTGLLAESDAAGPDNAAVCPPLLEYLTDRLVSSGWDLRALYRDILLSRAYRRSSLPTDASTETGQEFAFYRIRRLDAEVLADALSRVGPQTEQYISAVPEPFTYTPLSQPTIALSDGSITSSFLVLFGRPSRNSGTADERDNTVSAEQLLHFLNSGDIRRRIESGPLLRQAFEQDAADKMAPIRFLYEYLLSRGPTEAELRRARKQTEQAKLPPKEALRDIAWALVNNKEFLYRH